VARKAAFDGGAFYRALDATRDSRGLNWKQVAEVTGVNASTLTRMKQVAEATTDASDPPQADAGQKRRGLDLDSLASLCAWSGLDPDEFIRVEGIEMTADAEPLAKITALLHTDPRLDQKGVSLMESVLRTTYDQVAS